MWSFFGGKTNQDSNKPPLPPHPSFPNSAQHLAEYNPLKTCIFEINNYEKSLHESKEKIADLIDKIKLNEEPVSPRQVYKKLESKEESNEEKNAIKSSAYSKKIMNELIANTLKESESAFEALKQLFRDTKKKIISTDVIKQCELINEIIQRHKCLLNDVQRILLIWRITEDVGKLAMQDLKLGSLSEDAQELVDRWLYEKIEGSMTILFDVIHKLQRDIKRVSDEAREWMAASPVTKASLNISLSKQSL